jgi:hypothetical protein
MSPKTEDRAWDKKLHGFGTQFYVLGPIPQSMDAAQLDTELAKLKTLDPSTPVAVSGTNLAWRAYDFSWRYGKEGDQGHQGYHGLKRTVTDDFLCLGKPVGGLNETRYEPDGGRYYLWTSATLEKAAQAEILVSRGAPADLSHTSPVIAPASVYVNGSLVTDLSRPVELRAGANPVLVRYDRGGRGHFVLRRQSIPAPAARQPLAMRWFGDAGVIPFDVSAGDRPAEWFRFLSAPGTAAIRVQAQGSVEAWIDGEPMRARSKGRFVAPKSQPSASVVALRVKPVLGLSGGAVIPEPVLVETDGSGTLALGDWSKIGILNNYSGGARYSTRLSLSGEEARAKVTLDLGKVAGTAEVRINGKNAGVKVAPPWRLDVTGLLQSGENSVEILVYNSLANHYQTLPSNYRGNPVSGLLGPVRLKSQDWPRDAKADETAIYEEGSVRVQFSTGSTADFNRNIGAAENLMLRPGMVQSATGSRAHDGGGGDFTALFNGTAGNKNGMVDTSNDGATFVGMAEGNTLDLALDPVLAPNGAPVFAIRTYAGHGDARASQHYSVYASKASSPDRFVKLAEVGCDAPHGGLNEAAIEGLKNTPLMEGARNLRFVFKDGPMGFNVYREIAVFDQPRKK